MTVNETNQDWLFVDFPVSELPNWMHSGVNLGEWQYVDGSAVNNAHSVNASDVNLTIYDNFSTSSLSYGTHAASIVYTIGLGVVIPVVPSPGGGGGGGGAAPVADKYTINVQTPISATPGQTIKIPVSITDFTGTKTLEIHWSNKNTWIRVIVPAVANLVSPANFTLEIQAPSTEGTFSDTLYLYSGAQLVNQKNITVVTSGAVDYTVLLLGESFGNLFSDFTSGKSTSAATGFLSSSAFQLGSADVTIGLIMGAVFAIYGIAGAFFSKKAVAWHHWAGIILGVLMVVAGVM
jgi:hypothetical protein